MIPHLSKTSGCLWGVLCALALSTVPPQIQSAPAEATPAPAAGAPRDVYRAGMAAAARGKYQEAADLLKQLKPEHPKYADAMAILGYQIYAQSLGRPKEGLPFVQRAYDVAPADSDVVRAYVKTHVLAGAWFNEKDVAREHRPTVPPEFAFLAAKPRADDPSKKYPRAKLEADLDYIEQVLANCFAYLEVKPVDFRAAIDAIRLGLIDETPVNSFEVALLKLISLFCDGHARVAHDKSRLLPKGYAPFVAGSSGERVFLANAGGRGFLDPKHPYVVSIDGRPIEDWLKAGGHLVVDGSPQWHRRGTLEMLNWVTYLRGELGLTNAETLKLKLVSDDAKDGAELSVPVQTKLARHPNFPRGNSRRIDDIGYLRLSQMTSSERVLTELDEWMTKFRDTKGLILDVRGNLGGTKSILHTLFPYFMKPGAPVRLLEMTAYRLPRPLPKPNPAGFAGSSMSGQAVGSAHWKTEAERNQVAGFIKNFHPEWNPPAGKFSEWHVLALDSKANPRAYYYDKPLIVLQDSSTFSAGDIFVGAFEDHPNTTQIGTPSGGGNSQMETYRLPNTGLIVVLGWSAKFRPNGKLYDGLGVPPDITMEATPRDLVGDTDTVLDAAVKRLKENGEKKAAAAGAQSFAE